MLDVMRTGVLVSDVDRMTGVPPWRVVAWNLYQFHSSLHVHGHMVVL